MQRVAVIPARGGSTRLKNKNIYPVGGKPLICYMIEKVILSKKFDRMYVSTDSKEIIDVASQYKEIEIHKRDTKYATSKIIVLEAMLAMMDDIEPADVFGYFLPTCPFVTVDEIQKGVNLLTHDVDSVVSVIEYNFPVQLAMLKHNDSMVPVFDNLTAGLTNSKFIQKYYHPTGAFYISKWNNLKVNRNFFTGNIKGVEMPKENYADIDDISDVKYAENILKERG